MRESKFRGWDKAQNKMFYDGDRYFHKNNYYQIYITNKGIHYTTMQGAEIDKGECEIDRVTKLEIELMQYTGLKDKNGKDIYEGDILEKENHHNRIVKWVNDGFAIAYLEKDFDNEWKLNNQPRMYRFVKGAKVKVIGNIHENK